MENEDEAQAISRGKEVGVIIIIMFFIHILAVQYSIEQIQAKSTMTK